jgi:hypothetical protein
MCKTKPIAGNWPRVEYAAFHYSIIPPSNANRAKQSQFPPGPWAGRSRQTKPISGAGARCAPGTSRMTPHGVTTNARAIVRHRLDAPLRETKPNLGRMGHLGTVPQGRGYRAKQSQFPPERRERQVPCREGVMVNRTGNTLRQNKANSRLRWEGRGQRGVGRGGKCAKQSQFRLHRPGRGPRDMGRGRVQTNPIPSGAGGTRAAGAWDEGQMRQTKPIARSGAPRRCPGEQKEGQRLGGRGVMVNRTFDRARQNKAKLGPDGTSGGTPHRGGGEGAKQSQFPATPGDEGQMRNRAIYMTQPGPTDSMSEQASCTASATKSPRKLRDSQMKTFGCQRDAPATSGWTPRHTSVRSRFATHGGIA